MDDLERAEKHSNNVIFPRRKQGQNKKQPGRKEGVAVTMDILETVFHMPLHKACTELGVCATALKRACRKLGVKKWPYRDQHSQAQRKCAQEDNSVGKQIRDAAAATAASMASRDALMSMGIAVGRPRSTDSTSCSSPSSDSTFELDDMAKQPIATRAAASSAEVSWWRGSDLPTLDAPNTQGQKDISQKDPFLANAALSLHSESHSATAVAMGDAQEGDAQDGHMSSSSDEPLSMASSVTSSPAHKFAVAPRSSTAPSFFAYATTPAAQKNRGVAASSSAQAKHEVLRAKFTAACKSSSKVKVVAISCVPPPPLKAASTLPAAAIDVEDLELQSETQDSSNVIFPRRKQGQHMKHGRKEGVIVTMEILETVFHMPLYKACNALGVCATALKRTCRKLGVQKWPYRDQQCQSQRHADAPIEEGIAHTVRARAGSEVAAQHPKVHSTRGSLLRMSELVLPEQSGVPAKWSGLVKTEPGMLQRSNSAGNLHSQTRECSSDFESSVDTHIDHGGDNRDEVLLHDSANSREILCEDDMSSLMAPTVAGVCADLSVWRSHFGEQDDDFDSLDSEEDGLGSDGLDTWGLTSDSCQEGVGILTESALPSLEDYLIQI